MSTYIDDGDGWIRVLDEITARDIVDGDWIQYTESPECPRGRALDVRQGGMFVSLRWAGQSERVQIPRRRIAFRVTWTREA